MSTSSVNGSHVQSHLRVRRLMMLMTLTGAGGHVRMEAHRKNKCPMRERWAVHGPHGHVCSCVCSFAHVCRFARSVVLVVWVAAHVTRFVACSAVHMCAYDGRAAGGQAGERLLRARLHAADVCQRSAVPAQCQATSREQEAAFSCKAK